MSKAQELSDEFERSSGAWGLQMLNEWGVEAMDELRRLESENLQHRSAVEHIKAGGASVTNSDGWTMVGSDNYRKMMLDLERLAAENAALKADKAELLKALKLMYHPQPKTAHYDIARAAIDKHGGTK